MKKGKFIVIDGGEGSGKSTQLQFLKEKYPKALFTREPGGSPYAEEIRAVILKSQFAVQADAFTHLCLFFAARQDHMRNTVVPALRSGKTVISDRGDCSSFVYQLYGLEGIHLKDLFFSLRKQALGEFAPDLYVFFDISPEESIRRTTMRANLFGESNHFDERKIEFHRRVREGYLEFAKLFPDKVKIIDASGSKEEVWKSFQKILDQIL